MILYFKSIYCFIQKKSGLGKCPGCHRIMSKKERIINIGTDDNLVLFHKNCFKCKSCDKLIPGNFIKLDDGGYQCEMCAKRAAILNKNKQ